MGICDDFPNILRCGTSGRVLACERGLQEEDSVGLEEIVTDGYRLISAITEDYSVDEVRL